MLMMPFFICSAQKTEAQKETLAFNQPPEWSRHTVWYQIFTERFRNGNTANDPRLEWINGAWPYHYPAGWKVSEWTSDWYKDYDKAKSVEDYYNNIQRRRYGGDLQGIIDKLDYIQGLGITALYITPLNDCPSAHKYDARNFHHIDITFGNDPKGDSALIKTEDPTDPKTWHFTSADKLFLNLIKEAHKRGIKVVLDYSWNHTGTEFWAWKDILKNKQKSKYADWYEIQSFTDAHSPNGIKYSGWAGVTELPELKKVNAEGHRINGHPYRGDIQADVKKHIFDVTRRWLDPNGDGDCSEGIDGYRLDVADQIGIDFWRDYRKFCRSINPECYLVGEIWWEHWPDQMMDPMPYLQGDMFDAVMLYQAYRPARDFFAKSVNYDGAEKLKEQENQVFKSMPDYTKQAQMMISSSHDMERLLTDFYNKDKYKYHFKPLDNPNILTGKPDEEAYRRVQNYLVFQYTFLGSPQIYAGDEMGMWGTDDPDDRKPLWWDDMTFEPETNNTFCPDSQKEKVPVGFNKPWNDFYKKLIKIRNDNPVLSSTSIEWIVTEGDLLVYRRSDGNSSIVTAINNSNSEIQIPDTLNFEGINLLTGNPVSLRVLKPLEAVVIKEK